mmetsp:Transcript_29580/g.95071  ORF Transcript_29580/g.95071 Transcript_29580/m.95071 type:complete len:104 (+) Transcript_29580:326-637(+)
MASATGRRASLLSLASLPPPPGSSRRPCWPAAPRPSASGRALAATSLIKPALSILLLLLAAAPCDGCVRNAGAGRADDGPASCGACAAAGGTGCGAAAGAAGC